MDAFQNHKDEWKNEVTKENILKYTICIKAKNKQEN